VYLRDTNPETRRHSGRLGKNNTVTNFDVLLTVHLSIFILVINQLDAQNLFYNKFLSCLYMFRAPCAHCQEVKNCIIQPLVSSHQLVNY